MGVRVKVRIGSSEGRSIETSALLNTGFETEEPQVILPTRAAEELGLWPQLPPGAVMRAFETPAGTIRMPVIEGGAEVAVITEEGASETVRCSVVVSELESEVLLSDRAIEALRIVIESPGSGLWRLKGEEKVRRSEEPQYW